METEELMLLSYFLIMIVFKGRQPDQYNFAQTIVIPEPSLFCSCCPLVSTEAQPSPSEWGVAGGRQYNGYQPQILECSCKQKFPESFLAQRNKNHTGHFQKFSPSLQDTWHIC